MFLGAYQRYGRERLSPREADAYVGEMAQLARDLGAQDPPTTYAGLWRQIEDFRPELRLSPAAEEARDFLARGFVEGAGARAAHRLFVRSAYGVIPEWARRQLGVRPSSRAHDAVVAAASHLLCDVVRLFVAPTTRAASTAGA